MVLNCLCVADDVRVDRPAKKPRPTEQRASDADSSVAISHVDAEPWLRVVLSAGRQAAEFCCSALPDRGGHRSGVWRWAARWGGRGGGGGRWGGRGTEFVTECVCDLKPLPEVFHGGSGSEKHHIATALAAGAGSSDRWINSAMSASSCCLKSPSKPCKVVKMNVDPWMQQLSDTRCQNSICQW